MARNKKPFAETHTQFDVFSEKYSEFEKDTLRLIHMFDSALKKRGIETTIDIKQDMYINSDELPDFKPKKIMKGDREGSGPTITSKKSDRFAEQMNEALMKSYRAAVEWENQRSMDAYDAAVEVYNAAAADAKKTPPKKPEPITPKDTHPKIDRFEFSGRGNKGRFSILTQPLQPAEAAIMGRAIVKGLYDVSEKGQDHKSPKKQSIFIRKIIKKGPDYESVSFKPVNKKSMYSQCINIRQSMQASPEGKGKAVDLMSEEGYRLAIWESLQSITIKDMQVLTTGRHSRKRFERPGLDPHHVQRISDAVKIHDNSAGNFHVEFGMPDASTHPFLSTLMTMAAAYRVATLFEQEANKAALDGHKNAAQKMIGAAKRYHAFRRESSYMKRERSFFYTHLPESPSVWPETDYRALQENFSSGSMLIPLLEQVIKEEGNAQDLKMIDKFKEAILKQVDYHNGNEQDRQRH